MPIYPYKCECGNYAEKFKPVSQYDSHELCEVCGKKMEFVFGSGRQYRPFPPLYIGHIKDDDGSKGKWFYSLGEIRQYERAHKAEELCFEGFSYDSPHGDDGR